MAVPSTLHCVQTPAAALTQTPSPRRIGPPWSFVQETLVGLCWAGAWASGLKHSAGKPVHHTPAVARNSPGELARALTQSPIEPPLLETRLPFTLRLSLPCFTPLVRSRVLGLRWLSYPVIRCCFLFNNL